MAKADEGQTKRGVATVAPCQVAEAMRDSPVTVVGPEVGGMEELKEARRGSPPLPLSTSTSAHPSPYQHKHFCYPGR